MCTVSEQSSAAITCIVYTVSKPFVGITTTIALLMQRIMQTKVTQDACIGEGDDVKCDTSAIMQMHNMHISKFWDI